jgi:thiol peroxidase
MKTSNIGTLVTWCVAILLTGCTTVVKVPIDTASSNPGTTVTLRGESRRLIGTPLVPGGTLPPSTLVDAFTLNDVDLSQMKGDILLLSIVPSLDTKVCEAQTHYLGEQGSRLPSGIMRVTISRDTPFAQKRFATEANLTNIVYLSDYKEGGFGRATGLLVDGSMLLARAIVIADRSGIVRYIQVVPEVSHLPDMERAFRQAEELLKNSP